MKKDLKKLHEEFMNEMRSASRRSPSTLRAYQDTFNLLLKLMPDLSLSLLTSKTMTAFFSKLETRKRKCGNGTTSGVENSTIETYRNRLGAFFTWLIQKGHIKDKPLKDVKRPIVYYENREYLTGTQIQGILTGINYTMKWPNLLLRKRNELIIYIGFSCGLRKSEMRNLKLNDLDLEKGLLTVRWKTSKSKMTRQIPISRDLLQRIKDYIAERNKTGYKTPFLIVSGNSDLQLSEGGLKHTIDRIKKESGIDFHLHQLRHTFAVNYLLNNKNDIAGLSQLLGHRDLRMTARYLRCLPTEELRSNIENVFLDNLL